MKPIIRYLCRVSSIALSVLAAISPAKSQIEADNTLPVNSQVTGCPICLIEGGTVRGGNLFHSFEEFSVETGGAAFFNNALDIQNILGRVTGSTLSDIDGLILANGTANLFLINPNGIIFGENAQLDIGGSFVASTANAIGFGNQGVFSATEPEAPPLLTVNPDALFFNQLAAQGVSSIEVRGSLSVPLGESLLLVGGNIAPDATSTGELLIDGGTLEAFGGRVELAGVGAPGAVGLVVENGSLGLDFPADLARTDISIFDSIIDVAESGGGDIVIYPRDLFIGNSQLLAGIFSGFGSVDAQAGDITIDATGTVVVAEGVISNNVGAGATGNGGDVRITASSLSLTNGAQIDATTSGEGDAGKIVIRATDSILLDGEDSQGFSSGVFSTVQPGAKGNSGGVEIESGSLTATNGAVIDASTLGEGDAGKIVIRAIDSILLDGEDSQGFSSGVFSTVASGAKGNSGGVEIDSGSLSAINGAVIDATTFAEGDAGKIVIRANDSILLDGEASQGFSSSVFSTVQPGAKGNSGGVDIDSGSLSAINGAVIDATTLGEGDAGKIVIRATDSILLDGEDSQGFSSGVFSTVASGAKGNSGGVEIDSGSLSAINGAVIDATTLGEGDAGKIVIRANDSILLDGEDSQGFGSGVFSTVASGANGNSGGVNIESGSLTVTNGAVIDATTFAEGDAGKIVIRATESILFDGETSQRNISGVASQVQPEAKGNSGGVEVESGSLSVTNGAQISATTFAEGDAGKIVIRATDSILLDGEDSQGFGSGVISTVASGAKGNSRGVDIESGSLTVTNGALIDTTTFGEGNAGKIVIRATDSILLDGEDSQGLIGGVFSTVQPGANGNSEGVDIDSGSLTATNGAIISATTFGEGDAGKIVIRATDNVLLNGENSQGLLSGVFSTVESGANGNSGGVNIESGSLTATNGAQIDATTFGEGDAGKIVIRATDTILLDGEDSQGFSSGVFSTVQPGAKGNSEGVNIDSGSLSARNGAIISATTLGEGDAGQIVIRATDTILLDGDTSQGLVSGVFSTVEPGANGNSGGVEIKSGSLGAINGAIISASTGGEGDAGKIVIRATDTILLDGETSPEDISGVFSTVQPGAKGNSGGVDIDSGSLALTNGAQIDASTGGEGDAGQIVIRAIDSILLDGEDSQGLIGGVFSTVQPGAKGNSGGVEIESGSLSTTNGARITTTTFGEGEAGQIVIRITDNVLLDGENTQGFRSGVFSAVASGANGSSQGVEIESGSLTVTNGAQISADTQSTTRAGDVSIDATDFIQLSGDSGIRASATTGGPAGNLDIITQRLSVEDGAQITVSSPSGQAGNLTIGANSLELNQGQVTAETGTSGIEGGANIRLQNLNTLVMTDESLISATAFEDANGGNININSIFLIALPPEGVNGSDIIANAERGDGGRIIINGEGIFGIEERRAIPGNRTNDIDASSQFGASGEIQLNVPLDPARGLVELPGELVDVTRLVEQNLCQAAQGSSFIVTGRGGLPTPPHEPLNPEATWEDWRIESESESTANPTQDVETRHGASGEGKVHQQTPDNQPKRIIEAQGWYRDAKGTVILTAEPTRVTPHGNWLSSINCSE